MRIYPHSCTRAGTATMPAMCVKPLVWLTATLALAFVLLVVQASQALSQDRPESFADLAEALLPSVVNISTTQVIDGSEQDSQNVPQFPPGSPFEDFFDEFQNRRGDDGAPPRQASALGSVHF